MNASEELAPAVRSILSAARDRPPAHGDPIAVEARSFAAALERAETDDRVPLIAEVKPTSPTTDGVRRDDPVSLARGMVDGGAAAISVLTEPTHFDGAPEHLTAIRQAVDVPVLRKDFILEEADLDVVPADLVLLIARFLEDDLASLVEAAVDRGFQPLVEVHTAAELEQALDTDAEIIGINNRDLARLEVSLDTFEELAPRAPDDVTLIAESGITGQEDVRRMRSAGADALLVGSTIMDGDVTKRTAQLVGVDA